MAQSEIKGSIATITEIKPKTGAEKDVEAAVKYIQKRASTEAGCLLFSLSAKKDDPGTFVLFEIFKNEEALDVHKKQPHTLHFAKLLENKYETNTVTFLNTINTVYN